MRIKNYTSSVPVQRTITRIEDCLARSGVASIHKEYSPTGEVAALIFVIEGINVRLPVNIEAVASALYDDYKAVAVRPRKSRTDFEEQAGRTAWRLMQDWVEVQMSLVAMRQADWKQVFLPYFWTGTETYYDYLLKSSDSFRNVKLLAQHAEGQKAKA